MAATLDKLIKDARTDVGKDSVAVRFAQGRVEHFRVNKRHHKHQQQVAHQGHHPKKVAVFERKLGRDNDKIHLWTKREADAIELNRSAKAALLRLLHKKAALQPHGQHLVSVALKYNGTHEGSALQRKWANDLGFSASLPWCSIFVTNMLLEAGLITKAQLPANPAYSGTWIGWPHGRRVNQGEARPGDLLIFDWGDGGITDHVGIYMGGGRYISGNHNDQVGIAPVPWSNVVAVIRVVG